MQEENKFSYRSLNQSKEKEWHFARGLNDITTAGNYAVHLYHKDLEALGFSTAECDTEHYVVAHLVVTESAATGRQQKMRTVGQTLMFTTSTDQNMKLITRVCVLTPHGAVWNSWNKVQQNIDVGHVSSLDEYTDNGYYSGVYVDEDSNHYENFVMIVINNSAVANEVECEMCISQFKYALNIDSSFSYKTRTARGNDELEWGDWVDLGATATTDIQDGAITELKLSSALLAQINRNTADVAKSANGAYWTSGPNAVTLNVNKNDGTVGWQTLPAATTEKAGVMSAEDKKKLVFNKEMVTIANGTPENKGNIYAVRSTQIIPVKKGDKIIVNAVTEVPEGMELRYGYAGVKSWDKVDNIGTNRTEGVGYSEAGNNYNYYIFKAEETIGALFCVVLYDTVNKLYVSIQGQDVKLYATVVPDAFIAPRYDGIRFIADPQCIPIVDAKSKILDLGADPILLIGDKTFALNQYGNTHRSISIAHSSGTSATKVLFNVDTKTFKTEIYSYKNAPNEVTVCSQRTFSNGKIGDVSAPFNYKLVNTGVVEYTSSDVTLIQSYSDYLTSAHEDYVTIDPVNTIIDFGKDPILIIKGNSYILKNVCSNWRTLNYKENIGSSAVKILYNTNTNLFRSVVYNATLSEGDVVVGAIRHWNPNNVIASFPFEYKIKGELSEENKGQIRCKTGIDFIAHRGVTKNGIPENSLDAYRYAGYCGFKYAETDFCPTKDDELVLMHDASINRTMMNKSDYSAITDTVNVVDKTLQELRDNYVLKSTDVRFRREIPTLEEFFMTCKRSGVFPIAEIKTSGTTQAHVLKAYELGKSILGEGNFGFTSFSNELLDYARSLSEKTPLWYISTPIVGTVNSITNKSRESEATIWYPEYTALSEDNVKTHRNAGIKVSCWVVPVSEFDRVLKLGVDEMAGDSLSPDINGLVGTVVKTAGSFADLSTDGSVANNILTLASGQSALVRLNSGWIGGYYISIVAKGNFKVTASNLATTIVSDTTDRFIFQGLSAGVSTFKIEAVESTQVEFVEIGSVEF